MNIGDCKPMLIIETSHYFFINNVFKLYSSAANFIFFPRTAWTSVIWIEFSKWSYNRISFYKTQFYCCMSTVSYQACVLHNFIDINTQQFNILSCLKKICRTHLKFYDFFQNSCLLIVCKYQIINNITNSTNIVFRQFFISSKICSQLIVYFPWNLIFGFSVIQKVFFFSWNIECILCLYFQN